MWWMVVSESERPRSPQDLVRDLMFDGCVFFFSKEPQGIHGS